MKKLIYVLFVNCLFTGIHAQSWIDLRNDSSKNFYEIQSAANAYFNSIDLNQKGTGYKPYKRWEYFVEKRVYPSGDLSLLGTTWSNFLQFKESQHSGVGFKSNSSVAAVGTWSASGPLGPPSGSVSGVPTRTGRDNFITFHPTNAGTFWVGSPAGGLWMTTNNGASWTTNTDNLPVIGCSDLAIDPSNPNIMYMATGDGDAGDTYCIGVLKTTDGGLTWNTTGLSFNVNQTRQMRRLIINPSNTQILLAATNSGIYRSADAGATWSNVLGGNFYDVEFKPGDPNTVYAAGTNLRLSTDGGLTFTLVSSGIPTSGAVRLNIAVTPADPNYVYVLRALASNNSYGGLYRSTNSGVSFLTMSTSPDVLANSCAGITGTNGQGWYDLACAVSPTNANEVVAGGVNTWRSMNGGSTWTNIGCWNSSVANPPYNHADIHELEYTSTGTLYSASDGGVSYYTGSNWVDITTPRNTSQIYKIGLSSMSPNLWITGFQDNGTNIYNNGNYTYSSGGDGMDCFIDRTNNNRMYCSLYNGAFRRSTNGGSSWSGFTTGLSGNAPWVSPWKQDPVNANLLYAGYSQMFYSTGGAWTQLTATGGGGNIVEFAIAPSNNQVLYVIHGTSVRKTTDGGQTWTNVSNGIPGSAAPTFVTIDPNDENNAWVTCSGYSAGNKVFQTNNGGATWTNISYNLPNIPANCSVYQVGTNDRIYVGMDVGVYTKDNSSSTWTLFNNALPNAPISDMEISPAAPTLLRASTYGRGVYETELIQPLTSPTTSFTSGGIYCAGNTISFMDLSSEAPTAWSWSVNPSAGVTISSSSAQNPNMTFSNSGIYTISLVSSNGFGSGAVETQTIIIHSLPTITLTSSGVSSTVCVDEEITLTASGGNTYTWMPGNATGTVISFTASLANSVTYTVNAKSTQGCENSATIEVVVSECLGIHSNLNMSGSFNLYPNPASKHLLISCGKNEYGTYEAEIIDVNGKKVKSTTLNFRKEQSEDTISISELSNGVYFVKIYAANGKSSSLKFVKE